MELPDIETALSALRENPNFHALLLDLRTQFLAEVEGLATAPAEEAASRRGVINSIKNQYEFYSATTILGDPL